MRDHITINTTIKKIGNGYFLPITKGEKDLLGIDPGNDPDLIVNIEVAQRSRKEQNVE